MGILYSLEMAYSLELVEMVYSLELANGVIAGAGVPFGNGEFPLRALGNVVFIGENGVFPRLKWCICWDIRTLGKGVFIGTNGVFARLKMEYSLGHSHA